MKKLLAKIRKILKDRRTRQLLTRIISITAAIVVFVTTYALVLPAITMESEANCGIPAHQHDDSCYEERLICGQLESPGHHHTDACYSISKELICTEKEHRHDESCFDADGNLTCELAEHTHDDTCYEEVRELVCDIPESEGHAHTDECYERVLACGMEAHTHSTACYSHGSELAASAPSDFAAVATTELGSYGATVSASAEIEATSEETSNTWASDESTAGGLSSTALGATDAAAADYSSTAAAAGTASTGFDAATAEDAFVPQLEPIYFEQLLTKDTDIYYYHAEEGEEVPENSADIADWKRVNDDTELAPADLLRVYLRYTIPAGALNATNDIARYRLPSNLHLTDQQMEAINTTVNGIANQYVNLDTLEITDTERYNTYLGIEATEGTRKPSDNIDEYFTNHPDLEGQEYINAVVRAENVFDETTEEYLGQDLVFTFTPYTVQKNQHEYDAEGQPTKAGQKVIGWLCFDLHMDQIDWSEPVVSTIEDPAAPAQDVAVENTEDTESSDTAEATEKAASDMDEEASLSSSNPDALNTNTTTEKKDSFAEIVFAAKDKTLKIDEISTELHQVELNTIEKENDTAQDEPDQSADDSTDNANSEMTDGKDDTADDTNPEGETDKSDSADESAADTENQPESAMEINAETYPAVSFEDTITVQAGTLSTDNENAAKETPAETAITVSVIAEEETFPLGTSMQLGTVEDLDTVASAVEGAVEGQTRGFHAVDISFHNADGEEIEPLKPIKVSMTSDAIKQAVEDSSTAPVVVHVESPAEPVNPSEHENTTSSDESNDLSNNRTDAVENTEGLDAHHDSVTETSENAPTATIVEIAETSDTDRENGSEDNTDTLTFDAGSFSVYAIVYTVDFHYEINGRMYDFSIPGGGFVSLEHVVEVLGIATADENTENRARNAENGAENGNDFVGEVPGVDVSGENGTVYEEAIKLNEVEVSEATKKFVVDVESVEFSSPELVWVGKVENESTVGGLKEANGLDVEYSAELTEEQITEINAQTVEAGDWALISVQQFTSEEKLTVTMKNGDQFVVRVTDAQLSSLSDITSGQEYLIYTKVGNIYYVLKNDGTTEAKRAQDLDYLNNTYKWKFNYVYTDGYGQTYYNIYPSTDGHSSIALNWYEQDLVQEGTSNIVISPVSGGFTFQGYNHVVMTLDGTTLKGQHGPYVMFDEHYFTQNQHNPCVLSIYEQRPLDTYEFTVATDNQRMGYVEGKNKIGSNDGGSTEASYDTITNADKTNKYEIKAERQSEKYMFDYWDLDGTPLDPTEYPATIPANSLTILQNQSTLTAHFKRDPDYTPPDDGKQGREVDINELQDWIDSLDNQELMNGYLKTAELYDYANRIYRVDLEAQSNFDTINGKVDLGFVIDGSASMNFPAALALQEDLGEIDINHINDNNTTKNWLPNKNQTYYLISDKASTATVYRLKWNSSDSAWYRQDASKTGLGEKISSSTKFSGKPEENGLSYPIYIQDTSIGYDTRQEMLESSISTTLTELQSILNNALSVASASDKDMEPEVKTAWITYAKNILGSDLDFKSNKESIMSPGYSQSGGTSTDLALLKAAGYQRSDRNWSKWAYNKSEFSSYPSFNGTNYTENSVYTKTSGFNWESNSKKYVILITDGAPQRDGYDIDYNMNPTSDGKHDNILVPDAANYLKAGADGILGTDDDVTLITVGLSMGDVRKGSVLLWNLASRDEEGDPYFYDVKEPDELKAALYEVLKQVVGKAIVVGNVTDTINEAFYPVDILTGEPLGNGNIINLKGEKIGDSVDSLTDDQKADGYGTIKYVNGKYTVEWKDQNIPADKWHGTVYVKAKEDFLGGNAVRTNDPDTPAELKTTGYRMDPQDTIIKLATENQQTQTMESPRVNVNELNLTENETQWTVYLGTEVDPVSQINALFDKIMVEEVVKEGTAKVNGGYGLKNEVTGGESSYRFSKENSREDNKNRNPDPSCETFAIKTLIQKIIEDENEKNGTNLTLEEIMQQVVSMCTKSVKPSTNPGEPEPEEPEGGWNTGYVLPYSLYGQDCPGTITIQLVADHEYTVHNTDTIGTPAETYTLIVKFAPDYDAPPIGQGGLGLIDYHTGQFEMGYQGNAAGEDTSTNEHVINVFAKKLEILKADQSKNTITGDTATFVLYRKATEAEQSNSSIAKTTPTGLTGDYVAVQTLTTSGGTVTTDALPLLADNEPYYLVETKAPAGYIMLTEPLKVTIDMEGHNTWTKLADNTTSQTKPNPYVLSNWLQEATIKLWNLDNTAYDPSQTLTYDHTNDTTDASVTYKIINNAGVELPATGGPGTNLIYLFGIMLTGLAGAGLMMKRRKRNAA